MVAASLSVGGWSNEAGLREENVSMWFLCTFGPHKDTHGGRYARKRPPWTYVVRAGNVFRRIREVSGASPPASFLVRIGIIPHCAEHSAFSSFCTCAIRQFA